MATLTNTKIKDTYPGLIKLEDNGAVQPTALKQLTDGTGGSLPIQISQIETKFSGAVDLTGATVTGLPVVEAGLVAGTGVDSMKSADDLTASNANAAAVNAIAIGQGASAPYGQDFGIAIGQNANVKYKSVSIGASQGNNYGNYSTCIGSNSTASSDSSAVLGFNSSSTATGATALGSGVTAATANTATVKLLQIANYATMSYADDTAAAAGGIPLGGVYHTSGALKIRIV